ncbi:MAG: helix-turn-helix domain-containing protein [Verrucomicrobiales bacterium]
MPALNLQRLSQSASFRHFTHELSDPEQFREAVSGAQLRADFLRPVEGMTHVEQFQSPEWALDFYEAKVKARLVGISPPGWGSIALMRNDVASRWYGEPSRRGLLVFTPPGEAIDGCIVPGFSSIAVHVPPAIWERCRRIASPEQRTARRVGTVRLLPGPCFERIERKLLAIRQQLSLDSRGGAADSSPAVSRLVTDLMTLAWECQEPCPGTGSRDKQGPRNRARLARRGEEWLRAHLHEPAAVPDLCLALRVSRRELEYAFRQTFDQSPREFLQVLRLNAIHRALRRTPPDRGLVTRIALEFGVTHLGRFAGKYRALFGESPGESASRARR